MSSPKVSKVAHLVIVLKRRLDSLREMDDIILTGRSENGKKIFTRAGVSGSVGIAER
jgi:hypothetical protein